MPIIIHPDGTISQVLADGRIRTDIIHPDGSREILTEEAEPFDP